MQLDTISPNQPAGKYCPKPENVQNGYRKSSSITKISSNQYYGQFEIACLDSYVLQGNPVVSCVDGKWSKYPKCVDDDDASGSSSSSCPLDIMDKPAINVNIISSRLVYNDRNTGSIYA